MRYRLKSVVFGALPMLFGAYAGTFSYWWWSSPARVVAQDGGRVRIVEFTFNSVSWRTQEMWTPAFWFVEHLGGYQRAGFVAMYEDSVLWYVKTLK